MKKNISINISGIIFHIEEDGYELLRRYLDNINKYFATFEDSSEILADIESRIAEIFLSKLNEGKQVITAEDVNAMTAVMGGVNDFRAAEDQTYVNEDEAAENAKKTESARQGSATPPHAERQGLFRDQKRKILGGVCTGIAYTLKVDPVWVRLAFAVFAFAWGTGFLIYLILWIALPPVYDLEEQELGKKIFRNPENKVIGGVAGGVAAYFQLDLALVRVIFLLSTLVGGLGLLVYIVLWVILPEAKTLTERMQMQGQSVTLSNIESSYRKEQKVGEQTKDEGIFTKIVLFPFRILGLILQGLGKIIYPIAEIIRVGFGILLVLMGATIGFTVLVTGSVLLGLTTTAHFWIPELDATGIPMEAITNAFPWWIAFAGFVASMVPVIFLLLLGISVIARRMVFKASTGWTLFVFFIASVILLGIGIPRIVLNFRREADFLVEKTYVPTGKQIHLRMNQDGVNEYDGLKISLEPSEDGVFRVTERYNARGASVDLARQNARMIEYQYLVADSILTFNKELRFKPGAIFRAQNLHITLAVPYGVPVALDQEMAGFIGNYIEDYQPSHIYTFQKGQGLVCANCPAPEVSGDEVPDLIDFSELDLNGIFDVRIYRGDDFSVTINGPEEEKKKYHIYRSGKTLVIDFEGRKKFNWDWKLEKVLEDEVRINITMPELTRIEASGFGNIRFESFETQSFELDLQGPIALRGEIHSEELDLGMQANARAELSGHVNRLKADLNLASQLDAYTLEAVDARVEARSASKARVFVTGVLDLEEGIGSDVSYKGTPAEVNKNQKN